MRETQTAATSSRICPATSPVTGVEKPWIAIGAHYDHLGLGRNGNSLAGKDDAGKPHVGADDNASGSAAVLAIAEALARSRCRRRHLLDRAVVGRGDRARRIDGVRQRAADPVDQLAAYLNFDMVGRMQDNKLAVQATGSSPIVGGAPRTGERRRGIRPVAAARSVSADRRRDLQPGQRAEPELHDRRASRLPQAVGHGRQDQLRGPRSHRGVRDGDRAAADGDGSRRRSS